MLFEYVIPVFSTNGLNLIFIVYGTESDIPFRIISS
jgi:hypothetical protein